MVHNNRVRSPGIRHNGAQYPHVHLQIMEEAAIVTLPPGFHYGDIPCCRIGSDVPGGATRARCRQRSNADQLRVLHSRIAR